MNDLRSKIIRSTPPSKSGLTPEIQARIGHQLRSMYDEIVRQGVPERFAEMIRRLDSSPDDTPAGKDPGEQKRRTGPTRNNAGGD
ncbi:MAG: hypothetical protein FWD68_02260 [Alphaproteobacteria bacterium]|nr:hypothetical protein [Alphaproteobacteria bacterium]